MGTFGLKQKKYIGFEFSKYETESAYSICYKYGEFALEVGPEYSLYMM